MLGIIKRGFTVLELLIVIFLIGLMTTLIVVNVRSLTPANEREQFIAILNSLVQFGWQNALTTGKVNRVVFDIDNDKIHLEQQSTNKSEYEQVPTDYLSTLLRWPNNLEIQQFFIGHNDELSSLRGSKKRAVWFFIAPDGITQEVIINIVDHNERDQQDEPKQFGIVLNPFSAQFSTYDTFQSP